MALYAIDEVDDALRVTRAFLTPFDLRNWLKLALVVFFVGGVGTNVGGFQFDAAAGGEPTFLPSDRFPDLGADVWLLVAGVVALAVLVWLLFLLVGSVMEFVLVESLRTERVRIREYWGTRWRQGLRLFGFRLVLGLLLLGAAAALFGPVVLGAVGGDVGVPTSACSSSHSPCSSSSPSPSPSSTASPRRSSCRSWS